MLGAQVSLMTSEDKNVQQRLTGNEGQFSFSGMAPGKYILKVVVPGFEPVTQTVLIADTRPLTIDIELKIAPKQQSVTVTADIKEGNVLGPEPAERVLIRRETLDANPGRVAMAPSLGTSPRPRSRPNSIRFFFAPSSRSADLPQKRGEEGEEGQEGTFRIRGVYIDSGEEGSASLVFDRILSCPQIPVSLRSSRVHVRPGRY
jgi:hypothetical protein